MIKKKLIALPTMIALLALPALAGDLSTDVRKGISDPHAGDGNYVELGMSLAALTSLLPDGSKANEVNYEASLDLNLHLQYKGWFMEGFSQSLEQFTFGYNFADGKHWSMDLVSLEQHEEISADISDDLEGIKTRKADYMLGLRATGYYEHYIVQLHGLSDISKVHNGQVYSAKLARHWQYKNWNLHAIAGASYRSERIANYYLSVQPQDASDKFPEFQAHAGFVQLYEIGVTYPLSQKWVFRSLLRHVELDSQWTASPLVASGHGDMLMTSISYVF